MVPVNCLLMSQLRSFRFSNYMLYFCCLGMVVMTYRKSLLKIALLPSNATNTPASKDLFVSICGNYSLRRDSHSWGNSHSPENEYQSNTGQCCALSTDDPP